MSFFLCLENLLSNFPYSSLSLNKSFILMLMLFVIFFSFNYIQNHKTLSSFMTFFINHFFLNFLVHFQDVWLVEKHLFVKERMTFLKISHLHSSVAPCCIFVICNISSTILEYLGARLRFMLKCGCLSSSMTFSQSNLLFREREREREREAQRVYLYSRECNSYK